MKKWIIPLLNSCFLVIVTFFILSGCTPVKYLNYELPVELRTEESVEAMYSKAKTVFEGKIIFLDPGHGGSDRRNKGKQGKAIEADVNLSVSLYLRDFLTAAGAEVVMSRYTDTTVSLSRRSEMANNSCADLFISIHHNAPGSVGDTWTNYTSTYYHALETDWEYEHNERNLARYIQRDLSYAMRNSGGLGSFDGTYSDYFIYPGKGFAVLRETKIPAVLIEGAFFSYPPEENRLIIPEFNKIQAYGIFKGIYKYLRNSVPKINFYDMKCTSDDELELSYSYLDSIPLDTNSIRIFIDRKLHTNFSFSKKNSLIHISLPLVYGEEKEIRIIAANKNNNFALPFIQKINILKP